MGDTKELRNVDTADRLEKDRGDEYGASAWSTSGQILQLLPIALFREAGMLSVVASIVRKLVRASRNPMKSEHWVDIEVYVRLLRKHTEYLEEYHEQTTLSGFGDLPLGTR